MVKSLTVISMSSLELLLVNIAAREDALQATFPDNLELKVSLNQRLPL